MSKSVGNLKRGDKEAPFGVEECPPQDDAPRSETVITGSNSRNASNNKTSNEKFAEEIPPHDIPCPETVAGTPSTRRAQRSMMFDAEEVPDILSPSVPPTRMTEPFHMHHQEASQGIRPGAFRSGHGLLGDHQRDADDDGYTITEPAPALIPEPID